MEVCQTDQGKEECWLWVKMKDDEVNAHHNLISAGPKSVLRGRTLAEIKAKEEKPAAI